MLQLKTHYVTKLKTQIVTTQIEAKFKNSNSDKTQKL